MKQIFDLWSGEAGARRINNVMGWLVFALAAWVYGSTIEPTASFWDCPEFILCGYKLEVGHPPGAPFYMLVANVASQLAGDPSQVARMVNLLNALLSAATIMFLYWTITHLVFNLMGVKGYKGEWKGIKGQMPEQFTSTQKKDYSPFKPFHSPLNPLSPFIPMLSGLVGSLIYCFSDTFWFSAVEGEVYAFSSLMTAVIFWLILKWENHADEPHSDRYLVLIAYLIGLSIGIHLLCLLTLPAVVLMWYYRRHPEAGVWGSLKALAVSFLLLGGVLYGVVPGVMKGAEWAERLTVGVFGWPQHVGTYIYIFLLFSAISSGIGITLKGYKGYKGFKVEWKGVKGQMPRQSASSQKKNYRPFKPFHSPLRPLRLLRPTLNTALLCLLVLLIGYASYGVILIRSSANPPMDQNSPDNVKTLASYLARDQYGQRPLLYGQAYTSQPVYEPVPGTNMMRMKTKDGQLVYAQNMLFPRMWDSQKADAYERWMGGVEGRMVPYDYAGEQVMVKMPTQWENLKFFLSYQCNFMYWRYFMWNFCGRQNDVQGQGEAEHGNWITGIPFIDNLRLGDQSLLPDTLKQNKGHNVYYGLPLLLGLIGLLWQGLRCGRRGTQQFWVVCFLFLMTGLAIVVYVNQNPLQVRERDYSYAGSFYALAIWCGMGVAAVSRSLGMKKFRSVGVKKFRSVGVKECRSVDNTPTSDKQNGKMLKRKRLTSTLLHSYTSTLLNFFTSTLLNLLTPTLLLAIPLLMATENWDDHDRSHRYTCRDFGQDYLMSCQQEGNPILFCDGDNDTFPLWYCQEVEGIRTDIRVCNLNYLPTDWYIDQQRRPTADAPALPIPWTTDEYHGEKLDGVAINASARQQVLDFYAQHPQEAREQFGDEPFELRNVLKYWVRSSDEELRFIPTDTLYIKVDKQAVRESGMMAPDGRRAAELSDDEIPDRMEISLSGRRWLHKGQLAFLEVLANANWRRPVYVCVSVPSSQYLGLDNYLVSEGFAARFTPFRHEHDQELVDTQLTFENLMSRFRFGGMNRPGLYLDSPTIQMASRMRMTCAQLALSMENPADAVAVLQKCDRELPEYNLPLTSETGGHLLARAWALTGKKAETMRHIRAVWRDSMQHLRWISSLSDSRRPLYQREQQRHLAVLYYMVQTVQVVDPQQAGQMAQQLEKI